MKLNLEIELDWIDEESNLDKAVTNKIINSIVEKIQLKVEKQVEAKVNSQIDKTVIKRIDKMTEKLFNDFINRQVTVTDSYGSKIKVYPNVEAVIKERFDNFMTQAVNEKGETYDGSYGKKYTRLMFIIDEQLKKISDKFTTDAVKQVSDEIKTHVTTGLTQKLGSELMKVLKVNEMLMLSK